jgi:hypothetical protein
MEAPHQVMDTLRRPDQRETDEGRLGEVESAVAIGLAELLDPPRLLRLGDQSSCTPLYAEQGLALWTAIS